MSNAATGRDLHIDTVLANVLVGRPVTGMIVDQLVPILNVQKQSNVYYKTNHKEFRRHQPGLSIRAPGTRARQVTFSVSSDTYFAKNYALGGYWTAEDEANADSPLSLPELHGYNVLTRLMMDYEIRVKDLAMTAANLSTTTQVATPWTNRIGSRPLDNLSDAIESFRTLTGTRPNVLVIPEQVMYYLRANDQIRDRLFGDRGGAVEDQQVAALLRLDKVLVPEIMVNTQPFGETLIGSGTVANAWPSYAWLFKINNLAGLQSDTWCQGYRWTDPDFGTPLAVQRFPFDPKTKVYEIEAGFYQDEKIVSPDLALRVESVV
jgi:hypothetical protein